MFAEWTFIGVNAVAQGCCQLIWHSSTEEQGRQFTLNSSSAPVFGDCTHVCRMDLHRSKCSGTRRLVSWFGTAAQKNKAGTLP